MRLRADVFGVPIVRPQITEAGALGAAMLAGMATGVFRSAAEAVELFVHEARVFEPDARHHARYREKHGLYRQLYPALQRVLEAM